MFMKLYPKMMTKKWYVLDNFQTEHNNPCNDEGSKKESKNDGFIESVNIIEKDKSDNDLPKQVASEDESGAKQYDDKDETIEKLIPITEENEIKMQEPKKRVWNESTNPQHNTMVPSKIVMNMTNRKKTLKKSYPSLRNWE